MAFRGTFDYTLDTKNRLTLPAKFRSTLGQHVVLAKGTAKCVTVSTPEDFDTFVEAAVAGEHPLSPKAAQIRRYFNGNAEEVGVDSAGRIGLKGPFLAHAGLSKEVVVTGVGDQIEIWDRDEWHAYNNALDIDELTASFGHAS